MESLATANSLNQEDPALVLKRRSPIGKQSWLWEDEFPVFKFGYDKFIAIRLDRKDRHELQFVFGDFTHVLGKWIPGEKSICLNSMQMTKLCGMMLNNFLDLSKDPRNRDLAGRLSPMHALGESVYFVWSTIEDSPIANIRLFSVNGQGDLRPTMTGMSVGLKGFEALKGMVKNLSIFKAAKEVYEKRNKQLDVPLGDPMMARVQAALPYIMWQMFLGILQENCGRCTDLKMVFDVPVRREADHTCKWGEKDLELTDEICQQIKQNLEYERRLFCMIVHVRPWANATNLVNCYDFATKAYFERLEKKLWKEMLAAGNRELSGLKVVANGNMLPAQEKNEFVAGKLLAQVPTYPPVPPQPERQDAMAKGKKAQLEEPNPEQRKTKKKKAAKEPEDATTSNEQAPAAAAAAFDLQLKFPDHWEEEGTDSDAAF